MQIAIIGAGLSGRLVALNLVRKAPSAVEVVNIDRGAADGVGAAYSVEADELLLNVPAVRMGAFADDPEHFLGWVRRKGIRAEPSAFLPRARYREYILDVLRTAQQERTDGPRLETIQGEVTDIAVSRAGATLRLATARSLVVDKVVLALGNFPPRDPAVRNRAALRSRHYARNPWAPGVLDTLSPADTVVLIGTGQTTIDLLVALEKRAHAGRIIAISRRGVLPLTHRGFDTYESFIGELDGGMRDLFRRIRRHVARAATIGLDERAVVDSLRPGTQALWQRLPVDERSRFVRHLLRYWEIVRSRIPPESDAVVDRLRAAGQLEIVTGRIRDLIEMPGALDVRYARRGSAADETVSAALVVNCMGPEFDYRRIDDALVKNLLRRGLIRPGPADIGIDALVDGAVVGRDGTASGVLYTLGPPMKGVLWEVIAAVEIRVQADQLAGLLLGR